MNELPHFSGFFHALLKCITAEEYDSFGESCFS